MQVLLLISEQRRGERGWVGPRLPGPCYLSRGPLAHWLLAKQIFEARGLNARTSRRESDVGERRTLRK